MGKDLFLDTLAAIYDAALQPEAWPTALSRVRDLLGGNWPVMAAIRRTGETDFMEQDAEGSNDHLDFFRQKYNSPDTNPAIPTLMASREGTIILREQDMNDTEWHRCGLYREIYRPAGLYHGLGALILKSDSHMVALGLNRRKKAGQFASRDVKLLARTVPHIRRAIQVFLRLADLQSRGVAHLALWDMLAFGVVLLDREGKALWSNQEATAILARADGLAIHNKCLCASNTSENASLQQIIRVAIATSEGRSTLCGAPLRVSRPSMVRSFALLVAPIRMDPVSALQPAAVVFITDPESKSEMPSEILKRLYGLTAREAGLAALLLQGIDLAEAAERLGVRMNTVRTHLRLIFEKTDTHRQAELVRLLSRGPAGFLQI
jgi:DNA-binding CsgD family transcriptional regulator